MSFIESLTRKTAVFLICFVMSLGFFQVKEIFVNSTQQNFNQLFLCIILSLALSYVNGFSFLNKKNGKKK